MWLSDHDLDLPGEGKITVYSGRGILSESQGPVWLIGTGEPFVIDLHVEASSPIFRAGCGYLLFSFEFCLTACNSGASRHLSIPSRWCCKSLYGVNPNRIGMSTQRKTFPPSIHRLKTFCSPIFNLTLYHHRPSASTALSKTQPHTQETRQLGAFQSSTPRISSYSALGCTVSST